MFISQKFSRSLVMITVALALIMTSVIVAPTGGETYAAAKASKTQIANIQLQEYYYEKDMKWYRPKLNKKFKPNQYKYSGTVPSQLRSNDSPDSGWEIVITKSKSAKLYYREGTGKWKECKKARGKTKAKIYSYLYDGHKKELAFRVKAGGKYGKTYKLKLTRKTSPVSRRVKAICKKYGLYSMSQLHKVAAIYYLVSCSADYGSVDENRVKNLPYDAAQVIMYGKGVCGDHVEAVKHFCAELGIKGGAISTMGRSERSGKLRSHSWNWMEVAKGENYHFDTTTGVLFFYSDMEVLDYASGVPMYDRPWMFSIQWGEVKCSKTFLGYDAIAHWAWDGRPSTDNYSYWNWRQYFKPLPYE
ncbi:MAG: hypothetical protein LBC95_01405 [Candidatus Nomurabacteria bacterium]|jgi:hypothetical protein|nr:hypothetical protein [Candidatus Nomurabacteria bacterium]